VERSTRANAAGVGLYRTGDLARYRADGRIEYLGRIDHQVKLRGHRIELGEIEAVLVQHPAVRECVAVVRDEGSGDRRLVAYVVPTSESTPSDLRAFLKQRLPEYMLPSAFVTLERLPLTPNGKVDRKALPIVKTTRPDLAAQWVPPRDLVEETIAAIWREALQLDAVGVQDNFFELGGHSLLAVKVHGRLQETFERELSMVELFRYPTISDLATYLSQNGLSDLEGCARKNRARAQRQKEGIGRQQKLAQAASQRQGAVRPDRRVR
jgi:acyl carrier protein